jgi:hypothetical protein
LGSGIGQIQGQHHSVITVWRVKEPQSAERVKYWEIIADNLSKARMELGLGLSRELAPGEQSGLQTRIVATAGVSLCVPMKSWLP